MISKIRLMAVLLCAALIAVFPISVSATGHPFIDVGDGSWYAEPVEYVWKNDIFIGTSDTTFSPTGQMSRGMFITALGRMAGINESDYMGSVFTDIPEGHWSAPFAKWANDAGIASGYGDGRFGVDDPVTREQIAKLMGEYAIQEERLYHIPDDEPPLSFTDEAQTSQWAKNGLDYLRDTGIIQGYPDGTFRPKTAVTRAETAALFMRLSQMLQPLGDYISIVCTWYNDGSDPAYGMTTSLFAYDTGSERLFLAGEFNYTAQYPLGFYDAEHHRSFFTQEKDRGDQIFMVEMGRGQQQGEEIQLTDNLFAVNYILPYGNSVYFVAHVRGEYPLKLGRIDLDTREISYWQDDGDTSVETIYLDREQGIIYVSTYSYVQDRENQQNQPPDGYMIPADSTVYATNADFSETNIIFIKEKHNVRALMKYDNSIIASLLRRYDASPRESVSIDLNTLEVKESALPFGQRGEASVSSDGKGIYMIYPYDSQRSICYYDIEAGTYTPLLGQSEGAFINSIQYVPQIYK